jgi:hypothetical protein
MWLRAVRSRCPSSADPTREVPYGHTQGLNFHRASYSTITGGGPGPPCALRSPRWERGTGEARHPDGEGAAFGPFVFLLAACLVLAGCFPPAKETKREDREGPKPPNVVLIVTDDLASGDLNPDTLKRMPNLRALMEEGTTFDNSFVTNSLCCPSRATILRGQYAHNHRILHNQPPLGGAERFRFSGADGSTMATWVEERGATGGPSSAST